MNDIHGRTIHINGIVQGVGFRPFVYGLAARHDLTGWVRNTSAGVDIEVNGRSEALDAFARALLSDAPPLAHIDTVRVQEVPANGFSCFQIVASAAENDAFQPISPDVSICPDCLRELFDPADRRYRYPFINCTNCGPRFTIIRDIPYDRPLTTMAGFDMCPTCRAEYEDPADRRFHAQPVACPECGPHVWLERCERPAPARSPSGEDAVQAARRLLMAGKVVAVKGLGGFHLACDATNPTAVATLRARKLRRDKPFAVMLPDLAAVERYCIVSDAERALLTSTARPIVILHKRAEGGIACLCSPGQETLGVMLPYTPLHYLLLEQADGFTDALVMTSGNLSEEPIVTGNDDARMRLAPLADALLLHDRDIHTRCDDAVMRVTAVDGKPQPLPVRRSRGYAPFPVYLPWQAPPILATGAELKNTFGLSRGPYAFLSHHIGDLENYETLLAFEQGVDHFERLFRVRPQAIAYDLHPDYLASRYALERAGRDHLPAIGVQHHHAHIAACMVEHGLAGDAPVIGVAFDGTGYGDDGTIWGGEFLVADYSGYERPLRLRPVPLPGGDRATREPWRMALAWLHAAGLDWQTGLPPVLHALRSTDYGYRLLRAVEHQLRHGTNAPLTSSMGRLFDAVAALIGVRQVVNYEAQAAIELEALVDAHESCCYPVALCDGELDPRPLLCELTEDLAHGLDVPVLAARFHNTIARATADACVWLREERPELDTAVLSGGVWQNQTLLLRTVPLLEECGFRVLTHTRVPPNDGGLALGQLAIAAYQLRQ